ncbi:MAG: acetyl-CoA carboxylase biotin carboxyl carrier protein [Ruminococcus sp.]|nr:acetyl-CoA carboxylase biotin carboxyl carrier protein [Ruminococcus sp.]
MYTIDEIKELAKAVSEYKLDKIKIKTDDGELVIAGAKPQPVQVMQSAVSNYIPAVQEAAPAVQAETQEALAAASEKEEAPAGNIVKAPIVGTFYASPTPDNPPYVKVGDTVKKGDVLFIIESMKLMNEVTSDFDGVLEEILVSNGEAVEYDQPIMRIR